MVKKRNKSVHILLFLSLVSILLVVLVLSYMVNSTVFILNNKAAESNIIGGENAYSKQYPAVVLLSNGCTGTLIYPRLVLTAGHCLYDQNTSNGYPKVAVGIDVRDKFLDKAVPASLSIPSHDGNDIGLILLEKNVFGVKLPSIPEDSLYLKLQKSKEFTQTTIIGWGCVSYEPTPTPNYTVDSHIKACSEFKIEGTANLCNSEGWSVDCYFDGDCRLCIPEKFRNSTYNSTQSKCSYFKDKILEVNRNKNISSVIPTLTVPKPIYDSHLKKINLPFYRDKQLLEEEILFGYNDKNKSQIKTTCDGDSGAPLIYEDGTKQYIIGINTSSTYLNNKPSSAINLKFYRKWIEQQNKIYSNYRRTIN